MHELSIIQNIFPIIENVAKENHLKIVNKVFLKVGGLRQVVLEFLQFAFTTVSKGTIAENADLIIELIPITVDCKNCQKQFTIEENVYICPSCDNTELEVLTGKEVVLDQIEGEQDAN
jgi:hydrogenase nickel incorporation protein HypA/HybF